MKISAVAFSDRGMQLGRTLQQKSNVEFSLSLRSKNDLNTWIEENHSSSEVLIFICSTEAAVRAVSPYIGLKTFETAVIAVDELGKFSVPIVSGNLLIANKLATQLADILKSIPVITTDADMEDSFSVDTWAKSIGLRIANPQAAKYISSKLAAGEVVYFDSVFKISGKAPKGIVAAGDLDISDFSITYLSSVPEKVLHLVPPVLTLGIDCKKETSCESIEKTYIKFLDECGCHPLAVLAVCSIDLAARRTGLEEFCNKFGLPLRVFTADELSRANGRFSAPDSDAYDNDVDNICERSAVLGSNGTLFVRKMSFEGISMAIAITEPSIS